MSTNFEAASDGILNHVNVDMTVNENNIEVEGETSVESKIEQAINSAENQSEMVIASLDGFKLINDGSKYLQVKHANLSEAIIGIVGQAEYATSKDKIALLKGIVRDAFPQQKLEFIGSFVEPVIEKQAEEKKVPGRVYPSCPGCEKEEPAYSPSPFCKDCYEKGKGYKKSWLTADIMDFDSDADMGMSSGPEFNEYHCPTCMEDFEDSDVHMHDKNCKDLQLVQPGMAPEKPGLPIQENMPRATLSNKLTQDMQLESQKTLSANEKVKDAAVNALVSMLKGLGYGSAKVAEVNTSKEGLDLMTTLEDAGTIKAVNIPVEIKADKVVLPKKSLVSELISKGLDINAKLSEEFSKQVLERIAADEARVQFEQEETSTILAERPAVTKTAGDNGFNSPGFMSAQDSITLQKHLLPEGDWTKNSVVYADNQYWRLADISSDQNSKGEGDSSLYHFVKCEAPKSDDKVTNIKV